MTLPRTAFALLTLLLTATACSDRPPRKARTVAAPAADVLVTVNGAAITEADLALKTRPARHGGEEGEDEDSPPPLTAAQKKAQLETIVRQELLAQRAHELGLDRDPAYRAEIGRLQASVDAFRRQRLVDLYERHEREQTEVTEADARKYFDEHAAELQTEVHVMQILVRDRARIEEAHRAIQGGASFEEVAARSFPTLPASARPPWDLGFLKFNNLPEPWRDVVRHLEEGQTSGVIEGPRSRFWIVKLVDRRRDPEATFETWRANIVELLRAERLEARREQSERALRDKARIRYVRDPRP